MGLFYVVFLIFTLYPVRPVYYFPGRPSNTIPSGAIKFYAGFQKVTYKSLKRCDFVDPQGRSWISSREDNTSCISVVEAKIVTPIAKHIDILVSCLQEKFDNGIFVPKYEKSSVIPVDMCTKPCACQIISWSNKWMTIFRLYPTSDTKPYQLIRLHEFVVN